MIKGIISLFTSGAIFNPLVLMGIALGIYCQSSLEAEEIKAIFMDYRIYLAALLVSFIYVVFFKPIYQMGGRQRDIAAMIAVIIWGVLKFTLSALFMISFIALIRF